MRIANVVLNDFTRDNRVLKISATLSTEGHDVTVVALHKPGLPKRERHHGFVRCASYRARDAHTCLSEGA